MNNYKMAKPELYFSKYCKHSNKILTELNKSGVSDKFIFISIDKRFTNNNATYILNPDGTSFPLPPMINRVPVLLLKPNAELLDPFSWVRIPFAVAALLVLFNIKL